VLPKKKILIFQKKNATKKKNFLFPKKKDFFVYEKKKNFIKKIQNSKFPFPKK